MGSAYSADPDVTKTTVSLSKFAHTWFEIARLPVSFQAPGTYGRAEYVFDTTGGFMSITNTSIYTRTGQPTGRQTSGTARPTPYNAQLSVKFWSLLPAGKYHIYYINNDYSTTAVGSPDKKTLWIMVADRKCVNRRELSDLLTHLATIGFDTRKLVHSPV
jgi:apolipoprotein D and lipocalin family protein